MKYKKISHDDIAFFQNLVGSENIVFDGEILENASKDHTEDLQFFPDLVLLPNSTLQISKIMKYCNDEKICITVRGAGTGLSGGALPVNGGIVLNTNKLNKLIKIDIENFQAVVEPGIINEDLQNAIKEFGLFYPPDPASKGSCFLGGNVAHASGGPRALKYGTTRDYVLNLEVVLPTGEIIWTGANTLKYATGYNLTHLIIGSEGTLCVITKIVLKLISLPIKNILLLASFKNAEHACRNVTTIFSNGVNPSVCEFIEPLGLELSSKYTGLNFEIKNEIGAYLLLEVDGNDEAIIMSEVEKISEILYNNSCEDILLADTTAQKEYLWKLRRTIGESTKHNNVYKEEDTVVPRAELPKLYNGVKAIANKYNVRTVCYGHAGDGNLHVNILKDNHTEDFWNIEVKKAIAEIFILCKELGGTISGEHGIGYVQKEFMPLVLDQMNLELMKKIKQVFDPNNILNPNKIF